MDLHLDSENEHLSIVFVIYSVMLSNSKLWVFSVAPLELVQEWKLMKGHLRVPGP